MENLFENDAIINGSFKEFVKYPSANENLEQFDKELLSAEVPLGENGVYENVWVGNFFSVLPGELRILETVSFGGNGSNSGIDITIKNINTGEIQIVGTSADTFRVDKYTPYEITAKSRNSSLSGNWATLTSLKLRGAIRNKLDRYFVWEQSKGE